MTFTLVFLAGGIYNRVYALAREFQKAFHSSLSCGQDLQRRRNFQRHEAVRLSLYSFFWAGFTMIQSLQTTVQQSYFHSSVCCGRDLQSDW